MKNTQQLSRPLDRNARTFSQRDLKSMLDRLENLARSGAKDAARQIAAGAPANDGESADGDAGAKRRRHGRDDVATRRARRHDRQAAGPARPHFPPGPGSAPAKRPARSTGSKASGPTGRSAGAVNGRTAQEPAGAARSPQQAARRIEEPRLGQNQQQGQQGQQGEKGKGQNGLDQLGDAGEAMGEAEGELGEGNAEGAVDSQGRALDALRKGAQGLAQSMQQQMGQGPGPGQNGRLGSAARAARHRSAGPPAARPRLSATISP